MRARVTPGADRPSQVDRAPIRPGDHLYTVGCDGLAGSSRKYSIRATVDQPAGGRVPRRGLGGRARVGSSPGHAHRGARGPAREKVRRDPPLCGHGGGRDASHHTAGARDQRLFPFSGCGPDARRPHRPGHSTVDAVIDLDAIREQRSRTWLDPLSYLGGRLPAFASGTVSVTNGAAQVKIEQITINRVPMPVQVLQELVGYFTRTPNNPQGTQLDQPIPLPYGITELRQTRGRAVIVQ